MVMEPIHSNMMGNVHGGELMKLMDNVGGITAYKHAKGIVVTARVDEIIFHNAIHIGDIVTCIGQLTYVGKSSMQVMVEILVNDIKNNSEPKKALTAFLTYVHLVDGKPSKVPELIVTTKEEEELYNLGEKKYREIKAKIWI